MSPKTQSSKTSKGHGGARPGAGRPYKKGEKSTENVAFRITPSQYRALSRLTREGESESKAAKRLILTLIEIAATTEQTDT